MSQRKVTKRTAPKHAKRNDQYKLTPVGKALETLIAKPEPQRRAPGGGRKLAPLHTTKDGRGNERIIIPVTHLTQAERDEVLATNHPFWALEMNRSLIALIAAKRAAKGMLP